MSYAYTRKHHITGWDPEDRQAWDAGGAQIAKRNLVWSIICEHIGFSIWSLFSVMVLFMSPKYGISLDQKFAITATATLVGACLRIAEDIGLPVVVSSALETGVGMAAGLEQEVGAPVTLRLHWPVTVATPRVGS